jgi:hypothetical protein
VLNGPRGLLITPFWAVMQSADGPVVNLYSSGKARAKTPGGQKISLDIQGDYPVGDGAEIVVALDKPEDFTLGFRIPGWSQKTELTVNGRPVAANSGTYASIRALWKTGDRVSIHFDMRGRVISAPDGNGQIAIIRGPMVLSMDNRLAPATDGSAVIASGAAPFTDLIPNPQAAAKINAWMAFDVPFVINGVPAHLTFCDYADAGSDFSRTNIFRSWLPQPLDLRGMYITGQTWHTLSHASHWTDVPPAPVRVEDPERDLALATHGAVATSDSEYAAEAGCTDKVNDGILATPTDFTNRWHSSVESPHPHWVQIKLAKPTSIGTVIINFADPDGSAVEFRCIATVDGNDREVLHVSNNHERQLYRAQISPVVTDTFRLIIESSANPKYPNAAQVSEIQLFSPQAASTPAR